MYIPFVKEEDVIRKADEKQDKEILEEFKKRSEEILQEGFIDKQYAKFAENNIEKYLRNFSGFVSGCQELTCIYLKVNC